MNYTEREAHTAISRAVLTEVVKAGAALGLWIEGNTTQPDTGETWRWVEVQTPDGSRFEITGGSWGREGSITMGLATLKGPHGLSVGPRDVLRYQQEAPTASAAYTRSPEAIAKDLNRRICATPEALGMAAQIRETLARRVEARDALAGHVATLQAKGYTFNRYTPSELYRAEGYANTGTNPRNLAVTASGRVTFEIEVSLSQFDAVAAVLAPVK